jgi:uncharacterized membrane protein
MWFWWMMFFCMLLIPLTMIGAGRWMWKYPPEEINHLIGYRTSRSMKNQKTWKFAQEYCGHLWWKIGWVMLVLSVIVMLLLLGRGEQVIGWGSAILCIVQSVVLIGSIIPTELALKKKFG